MADPSILPTYLLSKMAAREVKVVLSGDGADELWAGYPTCRAHRHASIYRRIPLRLRARVIEPLVASLPISDGYQSFEWKAKRFALRWCDEPAIRHLRWMSSVDLPDLPEVLQDASGAGQHWFDSADSFADGDVVNRILALDFQTYLPGSVLTKVDRAAMAHGLEVRPPMLANELIDLAFSLGSNVKLRGGVGKYLLRRCAEGLVPAEVLRRGKRGFAIPLARWLRGPLRIRLLSVIRQSPLWHESPLCQATFAAWAEEHHRQIRDRSRPLWALVVLDHWYRRLGENQCVSRTLSGGTALSSRCSHPPPRAL